MSITLTDARIVTPQGVHGGWLTIEDGRITHIGQGAAPGPATVSAAGMSCPASSTSTTTAAAAPPSPSGTAEEVLSRRRAPTASTAPPRSSPPRSPATLDDLARRAGLALAELSSRASWPGSTSRARSSRRAARARTTRRCCATPTRREVRKLVDAARGHARMVTLATELPGGLDSVRLLAEHGVIAAIGHTDATYEQTSRPSTRARTRRHPPLQRDAAAAPPRARARSPRCWRTSGSPSS